MRGVQLIVAAIGEVGKLRESIGEADLDVKGTGRGVFCVWCAHESGGDWQS